MARTTCLRVALALAALTSAGTAGERPFTQSTLPPDLGIHLKDGECTRLSPYCDGRHAKSWTTSERSSVIRALDEIAATRRGRSIIERVRATGTDTIRRYDILASGTNNKGRRDTQNSAFLKPDGVVGVIEVFDRFFEKENLRDQKAGYRLQTHFVLHEFLHALDDHGRQYSQNGYDFIALIGMELKGGKWRPKGWSDSYLASHDFAGDVVNALDNKGDYETAWHIRRAWAVAFPLNPLPTLDSWEGPTEAFAEIGSHLILDSRARQYLKREIVEYFDTRVFAPSKK